MLRRISGPKREEVAGGWRRLNNEEFYDMYISPNIIRMIRSGGVRCERHAAPIGEIDTIFLVGKFEEKRPLGRPRRRWRILVEEIPLNCVGIRGFFPGGREAGGCS
jgi:hypothetical protein